MRASRRGLTLTELMISLSITAVLGLSIAGVSTALSSAYGYSEDYYDNMQTSRVTMGRVQDEIRHSRLVLACTPASLLLWVGDDNGNGKIEQSEVALIEYDAGARQVKEYRMSFPATMSQQTRAALDRQLTLTDAMNLSATGSAIKGSAYTAPVIVADNVQSLAFKSNPAPPYAALVKVELSVGVGQAVQVQRSAAYLRADTTRLVTFKNNTYTLN